MKGIKYFISLYLSVFLIVFISSCNKQSDEIIQYHDPITGDYICHDTFYYSSIIEVDSVNRKYIYGITHYDSTYIIHFDFKKDRSNLLQFQSESFGLTDSLTSDFDMHSNGGHEIWHLKFYKDSISYYASSWGISRDITQYRLIKGKQLH